MLIKSALEDCDVTMTDDARTPGTRGLVMRSQARYYDLLAWLLTLGRERAFRDRLVDLARLKPGDAVLDVGCGTGTLAIAAKRCVGPAGTVHGIDASPEMIALATRKATNAGVEAVFQIALVEALPFPDAHFDVILSTLMLHHLPKPTRVECVREIRRVLKPAGRVLAVDFATPASKRSGVLARFHRHGHLALRDVGELLRRSGLRVVESGSVGVSDLEFTLAMAPDPAVDDSQDLRAPTIRSLDSLPAPRWLIPVLGIALIAGHGFLLRAVSSGLAIPAVVVTAVIGVVILGHFRIGKALHNVLRRRSRSG